MKVFIVMDGEALKGGSVSGVFDSNDKARQFVKKKYVGRGFIAEAGFDDRWENAGCDWVEIQPHEVM